MNYPEKESTTLEFKESLPKNNQIVKTVVGFCNQKGGRVIIGVKDDGTIVGLSDSDIEYVLEHLDSKIYEATAPPIVPNTYTQTIGDKIIILVEVSSGMNKPYYLRKEGLEKGTYVRLGRSTMRATPEMIEELKWTSRGKSYDTMPVYHAHLEDLDAKKIEHFLKMRKATAQVPTSLDEALVGYNLITKVYAQTYPTVAGILLFGKRPEKFFPEAFVICSRFAGIYGRDALATQDCTGTLLDQYKESLSFVLSKLERSFKIIGSDRQEIYELPEEAVRESIVNALVHRNYHIPAPTKIAIFDNRVEVFSPGGLPGHIHQGNIRMGLTFIRNSAISKVFRELGYSEKLGTGITTIFSGYSARGLAEPEIIDGPGFVKYILPRSTIAHEDSIDDNDRAKILLFFEKKPEASIGDVVHQLGIARTTAGRRLSELVDDGVLKKVGKGRGTKYIKLPTQARR